MTKFILGRVLSGAFVVLIVATLTFFLLRLLPGGPFDTEKKVPPEIRKNIEEKYRLNEPLWKQYYIYIRDLAHGDFGPSYKYIDRTVRDIINDTGIGIFSAARPRGVFDILSLSFATALVSVPSFVVGAALIYIFSVELKWFPAALWGRPGNYVLPAFTLAAGPTAYLARLTRASMLEVSQATFVRTAWAKGLGEFKVTLKHIFRNALIPIVTVLGPITAFLVTGSFVVEHIFSIPGMGRFFVFAVSNRDYPLVMGITIVYAVILVIANLLVDICYVILDPRIKFGK